MKLSLFMMLAFGVGFQFPVLMVAFQMVGVVTPQRLASWRRQAILLIVVIAAGITPSGDPFSMFALALPMYVFYEISILIGRLMLRRRARRARKEAAAATAAREAAVAARAADGPAPPDAAGTPAPTTPDDGPGQPGTDPGSDA